jgi:hypothetical protein
MHLPFAASGRSRTQTLGLAVVLAGLGTMTSGAMSASADSASAHTSVRVCHALGNHTYQTVYVDMSAVTGSGHESHPGDIIRPPRAGEPQNAWPGKNWTSAGRDIYYNGCIRPEPTSSLPTGDPTTNVPTGDPTTNVPTGDPTTNVPTSPSHGHASNSGRDTHQTKGGHTKGSSHPKAHATTGPRPAAKVPSPPRGITPRVPVRVQTDGGPVGTAGSGSMMLGGVSMMLGGMTVTLVSMRRRQDDSRD